jgi:hypothetical protein
MTLPSSRIKKSSSKSFLLFPSGTASLFLFRKSDLRELFHSQSAKWKQEILAAGEIPKKLWP